MRRTLLLEYPLTEIPSAEPGLAALAVELPPEVVLADQCSSDSLRPALEAAGLPLAALLCPPPPTALCDASRQTLLASLIRIAAQLDAVQVQVCPSLWWPRPAHELSYSERLEHVASGLRASQALAEDWAVDVVLDLTHMGILNSPTEAAAFIDDLAAAPFGLALDCSAPPAQADPADWLQTLTHRIRCVRGIANHPQTERILTILDQSNYEGLLLISSESAASPQPHQDVLKEAP